MESRLHTNTRVFQIIFPLCVLPPHTNSSSRGWAWAVPNKLPLYTRNYHISGHFFVCLPLPICFRVLWANFGMAKATLSCFDNSQVIILCNISYFSARGYTSKFTHIYLGESGYPKLTMGIFRHPFLQDQKQMMNCRSCLCLQGNLGNLSRQKTLHIFPLPQLPALSCVCHPSFPSSSPSSKPPNSSLKPWGGVGCLPSSPACKLSPVKVTEPASERGVIYTTTPKTFHHTWTFCSLW